MEASIANAEAMLQQEVAYATSDYFSYVVDCTGSTNSSGDHYYPTINPVDVHCRKKMVDWCFQVVHYANFCRDTVFIALNFLDRYCQSDSGLVALHDSEMFRLTVLTSLYMAIKIHEPVALNTKFITYLSRGQFSALDVEATERKMLFALQWRLNPPTPLAFCRLFLDFLEDKHIFDFNAVAKEVVNDLAVVETEIATLDYNFISTKPSMIAFTSVLSALDRSGFNKSDIAYAAHTLTKITGINYKCEGVCDDIHNLKD